MTETTSIPTPLPAPGARDWAALLCLSVIWGGAFMGMSLALRDYPPLWVAAGRSGIGALALLAAGHLMGQGLDQVPGARGWRMLTLIGIFNIALPFTLLTWGLQYVPSAFGGVAMGASPIFVLTLSALFLPEETVDSRRFLGILVGFAGILVLVGPGALTGAFGAQEIAARLACISATACYGIGAILTRRAPAMPFLTLAAGMMTIAALILAAAALIVDGPPRITASTATLALVLVGLLPTGLAFYMRVRLIQTVGTVFMSLVAYIVPLWAVVFGIVLLGERLRPEVFLALALIAGGIALSQARR